MSWRIYSLVFSFFHFINCLPPSHCSFTAALGGSGPRAGVASGMVTDDAFGDEDPEEAAYTQDLMEREMQKMHGKFDVDDDEDDDVDYEAALGAPGSDEDVDADDDQDADDDDQDDEDDDDDLPLADDDDDDSEDDDDEDEGVDTIMLSDDDDDEDVLWCIATSD